MASTAPATTARPFQIGPVDIGLAPEKLWQAINPVTWFVNAEQVGLINISIGDTKHPELEREILDEVGSYGRQLGHIGDVLEVLMGLIDRDGLKPEQRDTFEVLEGELAKIRQIKRKRLA